MNDLESPYLQVRKSFLLAMGFSLLLHAVVLFVGYSSSNFLPRSGADAENQEMPPQRRLIATLARSPVTPPRPSGVQVSTPEPKPPEPASKRRLSPNKKAPTKSLSAPAYSLANRKWSKAEQADMKSFLDELAIDTRPPPSGQTLSAKALATARQMGRSALEDGVDRESKPASGKGKPIDRYSLEMYWDAFLRKLNRSAAFVENERRVRGQRKALVEISLNSDGSLKDYRVLYAADQAAEVAYIKRVVERASPFAAFPPDIRKERDSMSIRMCVYPAREGEGGGFSRSWGSQGCGD